MRFLALALLCSPSFALAQAKGTHCYVEGHLEDGDGELLIEGWTVSAQGEIPVGEDRRSQSTVKIDELTGQFRVGPFPEGEVRLMAWGDLEQSCSTQTLAVSEAEEAYCILKLQGPPEAQRLRLTVRCDSFPEFRLDREVEGVMAAPVLVDRAGEVVAVAKRSSTGLYDWEVAPVEVQEFAVEIRDPAFELIHVDGLHPGPKHKLELLGAASIQLDVSRDTGGTLRNYGVSVLYTSITGGRPKAISGKNDPAPVGGIVTGLVPGDLMVVVVAPWGERKMAVVEGLGPGERRRVPIEFFAPRDIELLVLDADGQPASGAEVHYVHGGSEDLYVRGRDGDRNAWMPIRSVVAGADGRVPIEGALSGPWTFRALISDFAFQDLALDLGPDTARVQTIQLPAVSVIEGRLAGDGDFDWSQVSVFPGVEGDQDPNRELRRYTSDLPTLNPDGSFRLEGVPVGPVVLDFFADGQGREPKLRKTPFHRVALDVGADGVWVEERFGGPLTASMDVTVRGPDGLYDGLRITPVELSRDRMAGPAIQTLPLDTPWFTQRGRALIEGLRPIWRHRLLVVHDEQKWIGFGREVRAIAPNDLHSISMRMNVVTQGVQFLDPNGEPLAETEIGWACRGWTTPSCRGTTDIWGILELTLPTDTYELFLADSVESGTTKLKWSSRREPMPVHMPGR